MKVALVVLVLTVTSVLAGCSGKAPPAAASDVPDLGLEATATTGVIRGVVVDDAIRPLANVLVTAKANGEPTRQATTGETGFFGFDGLTPGSYFLTANRTGFFELQASADVVAGVAEPPVVKMQLVRDVARLPYAVVDKFEGFLECGLSVIALCAAGNTAPGVNLTNDRFAGAVTVDKPPQLIQSEMVWETTTAASDQLWLWHSLQKKSDGSYNGSCNCWVQGVSPLVMVTNETGAIDNEYGTNNDLYLRVFTGSVQGTRNPTDDNGCYPGSSVLGPDGDVFCGGVGYSVEQTFTIYTTIFYGFLPPDGWSFTVDGAPEVPA